MQPSDILWTSSLDASPVTSPHFNSALFVVVWPVFFTWVSLLLITGGVPTTSTDNLSLSLSLPLQHYINYQHITYYHHRTNSSKWNYLSNANYFKLDHGMLESVSRLSCMPQTATSSEIFQAFVMQSSALRIWGQVEGHDAWCCPVESWTCQLSTVKMLLSS